VLPALSSSPEAGAAAAAAAAVAGLAAAAALVAGASPWPLLIAPTADAGAAATVFGMLTWSSLKASGCETQTTSGQASWAGQYMPAVDSPVPIASFSCFAVTFQSFAS
jgi:hypothetical protein